MTDDPTEGEPPLNDCEDPKDQLVMGVHCRHYDIAPDLGLFVLDTRKGHYVFLMDMDRANAMVQALREFIAGDTEPLVDEPGEDS